MKLSEILLILHMSYFSVELICYYLKNEPQMLDNKIINQAMPREPLSQRKDKVNYKQRFWKLQSTVVSFFLQNIIRMQLASSMGLCCLVIVLTLLTLAKGVNWQASGNMTSEHHTFIWDFIHTNFQSYNGISEFNRGLSNALNLKWGQAWNVFTILSLAAGDTVLYGYAFRSHWYWYNTYILDNRFYDFVIWKDYNCQGWQEVGYAGIRSGFTANQQAQIASAISQQSGKGDDNVWSVAFDFMNALALQSEFSGDAAYSVVMSHYTYWQPFGYVCMVQKNVYWAGFDYGKEIGVGSDGYGWGDFLLFQTR